jgi:hypothetical protein
MVCARYFGCFELTNLASRIGLCNLRTTSLHITLCGSVNEFGIGLHLERKIAKTVFIDAF